MAIEVQFHEAAFEAILTSAGAQNLVREKAEEIAGRANEVASTTSPAHTGDYYQAEDGTTDRARYRVRTDGARAARHEAVTNALLNATGQ